MSGHRKEKNAGPGAKASGLSIKNIYCSSIKFTKEKPREYRYNKWNL
jgi:hypothetical protein